MAVPEIGDGQTALVTEFALTLEALECFVHQEPLRRAHECVFGVPTQESRQIRSYTMF